MMHAKTIDGQTYEVRHGYKLTTMTGGGRFTDRCVCGFSVSYHMTSEHERRVAENAMRQHLGQEAVIEAFFQHPHS